MNSRIENRESNEGTYVKCSTKKKKKKRTYTYKLYTIIIQLQ